MAVTYHGVSATAANSGTSLTIDKPSGVAENDLLIAIVRVSDTASPYTADVTAYPSGWTKQLDYTNSGFYAFDIYYKIATSSEPSNYTWTISHSDANAGAGYIMRFSGVNLIDPIKSGSGNASDSSTSTKTYPARTSYVDGSISVVVGAFWLTATVTTPPSGYSTVSTGTRVFGFVKDVDAGEVSSGTYTLAAGASDVNYHFILSPLLELSQGSSADNTSVIEGDYTLAYGIYQASSVDNASEVTGTVTLSEIVTITQTSSVENVSVVNGAVVAGGEPRYKFLIDWENTGEFNGVYDDVTPYVHKAVWALGMKQAYQYMPDESEATFTLVNTTRMFSPENIASPLYGKMVPHRRMKVVNTGSILGTQDVWTGFIDFVAPAPNQYKGPFLADVKGTGPKTILERANISIELLENVTTDTAIDAILEQAQIAPVFSGNWRLGVVGASELGDTTFLSLTKLDTDLDAGVITLPFVGDNWDKFTNAFAALASVVQAEQGKLFFDRSGKIVFWNRSRYQGEYEVAHTFPDTFTGIEYTYGKEVYNSIKVTYYPRSISSTSTEVVWELDEPVTIEAGSSETIQVNFSSEEGVKVSAKDTIMPNTGDGSLSYTGGSLSITKWEPKADSATIELSAVGSPVTVSTLIIKGKKITTFNSVTVEEYDNNSISLFGRREKNIDVKLITDANNARSLAQAELLKYSMPSGRVRSITIPNRDETHVVTMQLGLKIGDVIIVGETQTQHTKEYIIVGETFNYLQNGRFVEKTMFLEPLSDVRAWLLGTEGRSELGETTVLGL